VGQYAKNNEQRLGRGFLERKKGLHGSNKQKTPLLCDTTNNIGQYQTF
jgi:hypothetical protein